MRLAALALLGSLVLGGEIRATPATVRAGDAVTIDLPAIAADVDELEVLLSLDGSLEHAVRLTRSLALDSRSVEVRVPDLPAEGAVFVIRAGDGESEREIARGPEVRIVASSTHAEELTWSRGELWAGEDAPAPEPSPLGLGGAEPSMREGADAGAPLVLPGRALLPRPAFTARRAPEAATAAVVTRGPSATRATVSSPLRN